MAWERQNSGRRLRLAARLLSRFGEDGQYRIESAKMLATFLHMLQGMPYIYQGEEMGMTNVKFESIAYTTAIGSLI
jgi:oligo-1,6-glucosidase